MHLPPSPSDSDTLVLMNACIDKKPRAMVTCNHRHMVTPTHVIHPHILTNALTHTIKSRVTLKFPRTLS